eukprot:scaffold36949_cov60-Phaeocystis_antarctica.AAC.6
MPSAPHTHAHTPPSSPHSRGGSAPRRATSAPAAAPPSPAAPPTALPPLRRTKPPLSPLSPLSGHAWRSSAAPPLPLPLPLRRGSGAEFGSKGSLAAAGSVRAARCRRHCRSESSPACVHAAAAAAAESASASASTPSSSRDRATPRVDMRDVPSSLCGEAKAAVSEVENLVLSSAHACSSSRLCMCVRSVSSKWLTSAADSPPVNCTDSTLASHVQLEQSSGVLTAGVGVSASSSRVAPPIAVTAPLPAGTCGQAARL